MRIDESRRVPRARSSANRRSNSPTGGRGARTGPRGEATLPWLLDSNEPAVRYRALRDLVGLPENARGVVAARRAIPRGPWATRIFAKQQPGGHWESPDNLYQPKYRATIWNVQVLALLGVTRDDPRMAAACELFLEQYARRDGGFDNAPEPESPAELCVTGNLTRTLLLAGYGDDRRVRAGVDWVVRHQLADGGWHCWPNRAFQRGTLDGWEGLSALAAVPPARRSPEIERSVARGTEFFLRHRLIEQGRSVYAPWRRFHFPNHYYYDALVGLDLLTSLGLGADERLDPALSLLARKRRPDGTWAVDRPHPDLGPGAGYAPRVAPTPMVVEPATRPSLWLTLTALRIQRRVAEARGGLSA
jgi:hypothetical protein